MNIVTYDFPSTVVSGSLPFDYFIVENVKLDGVSVGGTDTREQKFYGGNFFIFQVDFFQYFHIVHEGIAQYEILKEVVPDLKIAVISSISESQLSSRKEELVVHLELLSPYGITKEDIIFLQTEKPTFEKIFYYTTRAANPLIQLNIPKDDKTYQNKFDQLYDGGYVALRNLYNPYLLENDSMPKKIFFSRMLLNDKVRETYRMLRDEDDLEGDDYLFLEQTRKNYGGYKYLMQLVNERYITLEEENKLENYFTKKGYTVIDPAKLSFFEQINYCYNATHIAAIRGSSLLNTVFCKEDTSIFILDTKQQYDFPYEFICKTYAKNIFEIPFTSKIKRLSPQSLFTIDNIIGILETHYSDMV